MDDWAAAGGEGVQNLTSSGWTESRRRGGGHRGSCRPTLGECCGIACLAAGSSSSSSVALRLGAAGWARGRSSWLPRSETLSICRLNGDPRAGPGSPTAAATTGHGAGRPVAFVLGQWGDGSSGRGVAISIRVSQCCVQRAVYATGYFGEFPDVRGMLGGRQLVACDRRPQCPRTVRNGRGTTLLARDWGLRGWRRATGDVAFPQARANQNQNQTQREARYVGQPEVRRRTRACSRPGRPPVKQRSCSGTLDSVLVVAQQAVRQRWWRRRRQWWRHVETLT